MASSEDARSASGQLRRMASHAQRLVDWYQANKPNVKTVRFSDEDFKLFAQYPQAAVSSGFAVSAGSVLFKGFQCKPVSDSAPASSGDAK